VFKSDNVWPRCPLYAFSPLDCGVTEVLSFLQEQMDKSRTPFTLKVNVAAIAAFTKPVSGQSLGKNDLVIRFLKGAKRLNPLRPPSVPMWDLSTVLEAVKGAPFEPIHLLDKKHLSFNSYSVSYGSCFSEAHSGFTSTLSNRDVYGIWAK